MRNAIVEDYLKMFGHYEIIIIFTIILSFIFVLWLEGLGFSVMHKKQVHSWEQVNLYPGKRSDRIGHNRLTDRTVLSAVELKGGFPGHLYLLNEWKIDYGAQCFFGITRVHSSPADISYPGLVFLITIIIFPVWQDTYDARLKLKALLSFNLTQAHSNLLAPSY